METSVDSWWTDKDFYGAQKREQHRMALGDLPTSVLDALDDAMTLDEMEGQGFETPRTQGRPRRRMMREPDGR